ncbi:MAG: hypothetical protein KIS96_11545 [Bauldia sp.]|nr:hypothetical protein [Bauldia sp.]
MQTTTNAAVAIPSPANTNPAPALNAVVERAPLAAAIASAARVAERRGAIPVLTGAMIRAVPGGIEVQATDLDRVTTTFVAGAADPGLAVILPCHKLHDLLRKVKATEHVGLCVTGESAALDFEGLKVTMPAVRPVADWPTPLAKREGTIARFDLPSADALALLGKPMHAVSTEETRYYLNGVYLTAVVRPEGPNTLRAVATDGHRMVTIDKPLPIGAGDLKGGIVPLAAVAELVKLISAKGAPESVELAICGTQIEARIGGTVLRSKLIDGTFPDYTRVMVAAANKARAIFSREAMADAVAQVLAVREKDQRSVGFEFSAEESTVRVYVRGVEADEPSAELRVPCQFEAGRSPPAEKGADWIPITAVSIGFNGKYVLDMLATMAGDDVTWFMDHAGNPIRAEAAGTPGLVAILMPMRV